MYACMYRVCISLYSVQFDGKKVVSGAYDYLVKVWDPHEGTCLHTLQGHTNRVYSLQVCDLCFITFWDIQSQLSEYQSM